MRTISCDGDDYLSDGFHLIKLDKEFGNRVFKQEWCKDCVELVDMDLPHVIAQTPQELRRKVRRLLSIKSDAEAFIAEVQKELFMKGFIN